MNERSKVHVNNCRFFSRRFVQDGEGRSAILRQVRKYLNICLFLFGCCISIEGLCGVEQSPLYFFGL